MAAGERRFDDYRPTLDTEPTPRARVDPIISDFVPLFEGGVDMCVAGSAIFNGSLNTPTLSLTLNAYRPGSRRKIFVVVLIPDIR